MNAPPGSCSDGDGPRAPAGGGDHTRNQSRLAPASCMQHYHVTVVIDRGAWGAQCTASDELQSRRPGEPIGIGSSRGACFSRDALAEDRSGGKCLRRTKGDRVGRRHEPWCAFEYALDACPPRPGYRAFIPPVRSALCSGRRLNDECSGFGWWACAEPRLSPETVARRPRITANHVPLKRRAIPMDIGVIGIQRANRERRGQRLFPERPCDPGRNYDTAACVVEWDYR